MLENKYAGRQMEKNRQHRQQSKGSAAVFVERECEHYKDGVTLSIVPSGGAARGRFFRLSSSTQ